ncbi:hypothetical protein [Ruminococcus albus]|uniref:hypothetical protein n=1 Tax=Ruminococcus albus TaxID=1264 RepID=UPI0004654B9D|nr:hypothetical protein [Ruminococcus albus]
MKNRNRNKIKIGKRVVSAFMALVMLLYAFPITDIGNKMGVNNPFVLNVQAADNDTPPENYEFLHDENGEISLTIEEFYKYSQSYSRYPGYHQYDKITIKTSSGGTAYYERGFKGLGTSTKPFAGSIEIEANKDIILNLDAPLFSYVTDTAVLNNEDTLKIARFYGFKIPSGETINDTTPLVAENVVLDSENPSKPKATWNISVVKPSATDDELLDGTLGAFGGMIGKMAANTQLTLNVTMDQQTGDTDSIEMKSKSNLGLACGLIKQNAILNFSIGASEGGTIRNISKIGTSSGNVGGLVGEMESGSTFNYIGTNIQEDNTVIETAKSGYAGGLVGKIDSATITFSDATYNIKQHISGTIGVGGIYGYYKPGSNENTIDLGKYSIDGQVNCSAKANIGGLFGEFVCNHSYTIDTDTTVKSKHASGEAASYGGLIGKYTNTSLSNTLTIGGVTTETKNESGKGVVYGGAIGIADDTTANYIKFDGFKVDKAYNANALTFGGLVGFAKKSFVDANDVTIKVNGTFYGGGLIGDLGNGSLKMTGTTDLSNAKSVAPTSDAYKYGQIVGNRDNAIVFSETGWVLKRSEAVEADDIGAWGEVIRFDSKDTDQETDEDITYDLTYEQFDSYTVLTINETTHTISIADSPDTISTTADFAATALSLQISSGSIVTSGAGVDNITLEDDISLSGTGLTGFTRDNNAGSSLDLYDTHCVFDGSFSASGYTVTLAIGEPYGYRGESNLKDAETRTSGDGRIYNHRFNGLFGILKGTDDTSFGSVDDDAITIDGTCSVSPKANSIYVGAVAAVAKEKVNVYKTDVSTTFDFGGSENVYLGGLIGEINDPTAIEDEGTSEVEITDCIFSGSISGENNSDGTCLGGIAGKIYHTENEEQYWAIREISVSGTVENKATKTEQMVGGLIAVIAGYSATSNYNSRTLELSNVTTTNLEIKGGAATSMGGLLGYRWQNTDVVLGVVDEDTNVTIGSGSKVTASGTVKDMAGLVYNATGKWTVNDLDITAINIAANSPRSFGMIVNKGWYCDSGKNYKSDGSSSAIYLMLTSTECYEISSATISSLSSAAVFDELVAYSAYYRDEGNTRNATDDDGDEYILKNGNGIVSIHIAAEPEEEGDVPTLGLVMEEGSESNSYKAQTSLGAKPNPWTRYYYDLDVITNTEYGYSGQNAGKLMLWGLNKYAHQSIKSNFVDPFTNNSISVNNVDYDMTGYSWYPVDVDFSVSVKGNFKFVNKEFELSEAENAGTYNSQKSSISTTYDNVDYKTQHYLMHCGLFRNVYSGKTVTINGNTKLRGNVAKVDKYCGMLICGTVDGSSDTNKANITINNLELQGAYIHNIENLTGDSVTYAPLLINRITKYTNLTVKNVKTSTSSPYRYIDSIPYIQMDSGGFPKAGSSLIGEVGSSTAKGLNLVFETIQLDGRTAALATGDSKLNEKYRTNRTIFTKATLLDKFEFESGSKGKYTYTWTHDWGSSSQKKVTYGKEVGYITEGEFPNQERQYFEGSTADAEEYTNPGVDNDADGATVSTILKNSFLPYVATPYDADGTTHQLEVNHRTSNAEGCGTYNDPYIIKKASELQNIALIINGGATTGTKITLPNSTERTAFWCDDKSGKSHHMVFECNGSNFVNGDISLTTQEVRTYLASAYYKLGDNITLDSFDGISNFTAIDSTNNFAVFRGVIDGGELTIINKSASPLIVNSYGCVIKNLTVSVEKESQPISLTQANATDTFPTCKSYGGLIANVLGGDNIIDGTSVNYSNMKKGFTIGNSTYGHLIPIGGYVGVVVNGAVVFKNMTNSTQGLTTISSSYLPQLTNQKYLYVNPIIGRVINGYAVTESSSYKTSENDVTMHNGRKNYSIADITKSNDIAMLSTGAYTSIGTSSYSTDVSIPNAQALFVMSLLTQSSTTVGDPSTLALGSSDSYGGTYHRMRCADYSAVGTNAANDNKPADYTVAVADHTSTSVPFLVKNYTNVISGTTNYGVLALTNNNTVCNFNLGGTETEWTLPDGFRGIGCIGFKRSNLTNRTISLHKFNGKNNYGEGDEVTIKLNMSLQHYERDQKNSVDYENYYPVNNGQGGFGLFNTLHHNRADQGTIEDEYKISNLNITGKIDYFVFKHSDNNGVMTYNKTYIPYASYLNCGGISGYAGFGGDDSITVEAIGVSGLTVNGFETAGGFFGNLQLSANSATSHQVSISDIDAQEAFTVHSKRYAGGIIGYFKQGNLSISDVKILLPTVLNEYVGSSITDFDNGVGGLIGYCQNVNGNSPIVLTDIQLGQLSSNVTSRIGYIDGYPCTSATTATVVAGGIIGRNNTYKGSNDYSLKIENCNVYNISIYGHRVGGLIGSDAADNNTNTQSKILIYNSNVKSNNESELYGLFPSNSNSNNLKHRACGGIFGGARAANGVIIDTCSVEGYTLQGYQDTAGICANVDGGGFGVRNFMIKDVVLKSDYSAALFGWLPKPLTGYNILCDNVQFQDRNGGTSYNSAQHGYLVSKNNGNSIKIAGLSIQNATPKSLAYFIPPRLSGTNDYNANAGYVIFADYKGTASSGNKVFSNINSSANVKDYKNQDVTDNNPYVTSSPKLFIGDNQFLTGDAVSSTTYDGSAFEQIILDKQDTQKSQNGAQSYQTAPAVNTNQLKDVTDHLKTTREEFGSAFPYNFPLLEVEDSDRTKVTNYINYYLRNLTNTNYDFSLASNNSAIKDIFKVTLHSCVYDKTTRTFTVDPAENSGSLKHYAGAFQMEPGSIDNADPSTPQFTLMDVQFFDPDDKTKIAYHLYVPIYVKKEINYKFNAQIASGTNYYEDAYTGISSKTLFENLGNPVTARIEYTYDRTATDWADAINGGENVLYGSNYFKELKMSMNSNGWAPDSRLVLVDANNNDKHYYLDSSIVTADSNGIYHIPFDSFTANGASGGAAYKPVAMSSLLEYTVSATNNGPLVVTTDATKATVKSPDGNTMYMPRPEGNSAQGYTVDVTEVNPEVYYLSFFTNKNSGNDKVYHYEINSVERFEQHSTDNDNWKPNKIIRSYNNPVHLIIGNLYTNNNLELSVTPRVASTYEMTKSNNVLTITMTSHISLTQAAKDEKIPQNLAQNVNSTIYQTFLMNYDMMEKDALTSKIGVDTSAIQSVTITDYKIYYGLTVPTEAADIEANPGEDVRSNASDPEDLMNSNYIELRNNKNLNEYLRNSTAGHDNAATIHVTFAIEYSEKNLSKQFPERKDESDSTIGSLVRGFSNISSVAESGAYSAISLPASDTHRYYTKNISSAKLTYTANKTPSSPNGQYSSLGINPFDEQTAKVVTNKGHIDSTAIYSYVDIVDPGEYIEFNLTLTCKNDGGYDKVPLVISDYLNNLTIKANNTTLFTQGSSSDTALLKAYTSVDGTMITLRAHKSKLKEIADKIYTIDISYDILTGEVNGFGKTKAYSNYKVSLTADLYDAIGTTVTPDNPTHAWDHIIYTNSKLQYNMISE